MIDANANKKEIPAISVKTFNSAEIYIPQAAPLFQPNPALENRFIHYRMQNDLVSPTSSERTYGNIYSFFAHNALWSHGLSFMKSVLPKEILNQPLKSHHSLEKNLLLEEIECLKHAYAARVQQQWFIFSSSKKAIANQSSIEFFSESLKKMILSDVKDPEKFREYFRIWKENLNGRVSTSLVNNLEKQVLAFFHSPQKSSELILPATSQSRRPSLQDDPRESATKTRRNTL